MELFTVVVEFPIVGTLGTCIVVVRISECIVERSSLNTISISSPV